MDLSIHPVKLCVAVLWEYDDVAQNGLETAMKEAYPWAGHHLPLQKSLSMLQANS